MTTIRIKQYSFSFPSRYAAGHVLDEAEAEALEALRAENVRNQVTRQIVERATRGLGAGELLSPTALAETTKQVARYAERYVFGKKKGGKRFGVLETEARQIARAVVLSRARSAGTVLDEAALLAAIETEAATDAVQMEARARLTDSMRVANGALEDLL